LPGEKPVLSGAEGSPRFIFSYPDVPMR